MSREEKQNFDRFYKLIFEKSKLPLFKYFLSRKKSSLTAILDNAKHTLYHLWKYDSKCCKCEGNPTLSEQQSLYRYQWDSLFDTNDKQNCRIKPCICIYKAKPALGVNDLDIQLEIRLMQELLSMPRHVIKGIEKIRKYRNELAHPKYAQIAKDDFCAKWKDANKCIMLIAKECSSDVASNFQKEAQSLLNTVADKSTSTDEQINEDLKAITFFYKRDPNAKIVDNVTDQDATNSMNSSGERDETQRSMGEYWRIRERIEQLLPYFRDILDPVTTVEHFYHHDRLTQQQRQKILDMKNRRERAIEFLKIVKKMSDEIFFVESLSSTGQREIHEALTQEHEIPSVQICFVKGLPYVNSSVYMVNKAISSSRTEETQTTREHEPLSKPEVKSEPVRNVNIVLRYMGENGAVKERVLLDKLQNDHDICDNIVNENTKLSLKGSQEGSVVMHLYSKDDGTDVLSNVHTAFVKGDIMRMIRKLIENGKSSQETKIEVVFRINEKDDMPLYEGNNVYQSQMKYLLEELCPKPVAVVLYEEQVLSLNEVQIVLSDQHWDMSSQVHQLIKILNTKRLGFQPFLHALRETFQDGIADTLCISEKAFYRQNLDYLLDELCPRPVAAELYEMEIINLQDVQLIFSGQCSDRESQVKQLVEILVTNQGSMEHFKQALRNTYQHHIAKAMSAKDLEVVVPDIDIQLQYQIQGTTEVNNSINTGRSALYQSDSENEENKNIKSFSVALKREKLQIDNMIYLQPSIFESKQLFLNKILDIYNRLGNIINDCRFELFRMCVEPNRLSKYVPTEDPDYMCILYYLRASCCMAYKECPKPFIKSLLKVSSQTTCPNLAVMFHHNVQTRKLLIEKDYPKLSKALCAAKRAIANDVPGNAGQAAGWVYVNDARYKIAQMSQLSTKCEDYEKDYNQLYYQAKTSFQCALKHFEVDDSEDKEYGTEYTIYRLVILLMRCGDNGETMGVQQPLEEGIKQARIYLQQFSSPCLKSLKVHCFLATCDYQFRVGEVSGALKNAKEALNSAESLELNEFIEDAQNRVLFLEKKV